MTFRKDGLHQPPIPRSLVHILQPKKVIISIHRATPMACSKQSFYMKLRHHPLFSPLCLMEGMLKQLLNFTPKKRDTNSTYCITHSLHTTSSPIATTHLHLPSPSSGAVSRWPCEGYRKESSERYGAARGR